MTTLAEKCAAYAIGTRYDQLPPEIVATARDCLMDTLGAAIAGSNTAPALAAAAATKRWASSGTCTTLGMAAHTAAAPAALVNGTSAHALELDDTDAAGLCHPGTVVIPAALAVAEETNASGAQLISALVVGYELTVRLARWVNPRHRLRGFHTTGTIATLGAAAAVARLRGLENGQAARALGIAGSFASGLFEFTADGSTVKRAHAGNAAFSAILAADLAAGGMTGPLSVLEGDHGLYRAMVGDGTMPRFPVEQLGSTYVIGEVGHKPYPCCRFTHASIDAALALHQKYAAAPDTAVEVRASRLCIEQTGSANPRNQLERQFSTPYGVSLALLHGQVQLSDYQEPDQEALRLAAATQTTVDPQLPLNSRTSTVQLHHADGSADSAQVHTPLGDPARPLSKEELVAKFRDLAGTRLNGWSVDKICKLFQQIHTIARIQDLTGHLVPDATGGSR